MRSGPPQAAADYMAGFQPPEKGQLYRPLLAVMDQWSRNDPIAAGTWATQAGRARVVYRSVGICGAARGTQ